MAKKKHTGPKILIYDIETSPILAHVWGLWENNVAINQIEKDWHLLSFSAKWLHDPDNKIVYMDQRNEKNIEDDSKILKVIWKLLDEADIALTQNGIAFDNKKLNARFILNGMKPPSSYRNIDTLRLAKKNFAFTSNKLEYLSNKLNKKYKKKTKRQFSGFELWKECLAGNKNAWKEMEQYNKLDVLALQEVYKKLAPWGTGINVNVYTEDGADIVCSSCNGKTFTKNGFRFTNGAKYQRLTCSNCGAETRSKVNELTAEKKKSLRSE